MDLKNKKGVDLSSANGSVDMNKIKAAGYDFVMLRCGYGNDDTSQDDSRFESNVKKAEAAGLPWGAYIYSYALDTNEAKSEAQHVIRLLRGKKPTMPIALDMEDADGYKRRNGMPTNNELVKICETFLSTIKKAGYYPMLYASLSWLDNQLNNKSLQNSYDIWCAQWNSVCQYDGSRLGMWQYGGETNYLESNSISGVGTVDKDMCYKDYPSIIKNGGYNNWSGAKVLDEKGFEKGDETYGVFALKELILIAKKLGIITQGVDENNAFGDGTEAAVNQILKRGGYAQNGIAGYGLIKYLAGLIKKKLG
ncbi:MAG: glycoside hydrolase family 25 protein [Ruminococcus sp.]|nr:glycoside hydrolase family 25 protein [Ruminococcus sp.]